MYYLYLLQNNKNINVLCDSLLPVAVLQPVWGWGPAADRSCLRADDKLV